MDGSKNTVKVSDAAKELGMSQLAVRMLMRQGVLPIGIATKLTGNQYRYYIYREKLNDFLGKRKEISDDACT